MSDPAFQPDAIVQSRQDGLWDKAPAWRTLTVAASLLTLAAIATPLLLPPPAETGQQVRPASARPVASTQAASTPPHMSPLPAAPLQASAPATIPKPTASVLHGATPHVRTASLPSHAEAAPLPAPEPSVVPEQAAPARPDIACGITVGTQALPMGAGIVTGYEGVLEAQRRMAANERTIGGHINPNFANTPRAIIQPDGNSPDAQRQIVVVPPGMTVGIGDHVTFNGLHRDAGLPCGYVPPLITSDTGPSGANPPPMGQAAGAHPTQTASLPPPSAQPTINPSTEQLPATADLPLGTIVVSPGVEARVNRHNRYGKGQDFPITITILSPPAHGTVTTREGTAPVTYNNGVTRISAVTQVFYKSAPGYTGTDTFTYKRTSADPSDPLNANTYTITVGVK